jgi:hypothetical protein
MFASFVHLSERWVGPLESTTRASLSERTNPTHIAPEVIVASRLWWFVFTYEHFGLFLTLLANRDRDRDSCYLSSKAFYFVIFIFEMSERQKPSKFGVTNLACMRDAGNFPRPGFGFDGAKIRDSKSGSTFATPGICVIRTGM